MPQETPTASQATKHCRKCREEVKKDAVKCKHCMADLRSWPARHKILTAFGGFFLLTLVLSSASPAEKVVDTNKQSATEATQPSESVPANTAPSAKTPVVKPPSKPVATQPTPVKTPPIPSTSFGNGNYVVGRDIQPGTYRTRTAPTRGCYYARLSGFGGTLSEIIANDNTTSPAVVTIAPSDKGFTSSGCGTWSKDLSQITTSQTSFGNGIFIINTDILPGTYRNDGTDSCYYARLSGFGGAINEIISNENTDSSVIVSIASSDKGFHSTGCGKWTQISL